MRYCYSFCFAILLSLSGAAFAQADTAAVERFLADLDTLQADFEQRVLTQRGSSNPVTGVFYLRRPGQFRWDYAGDMGQQIVADGRRVWLLDRELEQISHQSQRNALRGTPAQLLAEGKGINDYFTFVASYSDSDADWVELAPQDADSQIELIAIGIKNGQLIGLVMQDKFDQTTEFRFTNVQRNPSLPERLFRFETPPGYDVWEY